MQSNMTMMMCVIKMEQWKLHGNISWNGYGNAIIGRYDGCFEEDIMRRMYDRAYLAKDMNALENFVPILKMRKGNARHGRG